MDILFWSGGKDAYLALQFYRQERSDTEIRLLTTYNEETNIVPHQNIALSNIQKQADNLGLELITVPLPAKCPNPIYINKVGEALGGLNTNIDHLVFGDWHLEDIRKWREQIFGEIGYDCLFPIWEKGINELLPVLFFNPIDIEISAVAEEFQQYIRIGEAYNQPFVVQLQHLNKDIDPLGENGEFHTKLIFKDFQETFNS